MNTTKTKKTTGKKMYILLYPKDKKSRLEDILIEVKINSSLEVAGYFEDKEQAAKMAKLFLLGKGAIDTLNKEASS